MWIKKSDIEFNYEIKREFIRNLLLIFIITIILLCIADKYGCGKTGLGYPITFLELLNHLPIIVLISLIISIIFSLYLRYHITTVICLRCYMITDKNNRKCDCGGEYIDLRKMKWIDTK